MEDEVVDQISHEVLPLLACYVSQDEVLRSPSLVPSWIVCKPDGGVLEYRGSEDE